MSRYVLLMRHGKHEAAGPSATTSRKLSGDGEKETREVAERLASVLQELKDDNDLSISIGDLYRAGTDEVLSTANLVVHVLGNHLQCAPEHHADLDPTSFKPYRNINKHVQLVGFSKKGFHLNLVSMPF
jgi:phosphohistidine phosphatase SixA